MSKVKWGAKSDFEYIHNYKILQRVFDKKHISKHIEVQKLIRGRYQDNLEVRLARPVACCRCAPLLTLLCRCVVL